MDEPPAPGPRRKFDWLSAVMALVASVALGWAAWLRFAPAPRGAPPAVGAMAPPLRLLDLQQGQPLVLAGLRGRVVWVTFWSVNSSTAKHDLWALEAAWQQLKPWRQFALVAAAVDVREPARVRAMLQQAGTTLPAYLASPDTAHAFGAGGQPLHVLLDEAGRVVAVARGSDAGTVDRLIRQAEARLELIEPRQRGRFAYRYAGLVLCSIFHVCEPGNEPGESSLIAQGRAVAEADEPGLERGEAAGRLAIERGVGREDTQRLAQAR